MKNDSPTRCAHQKQFQTCPLTPTQTMSLLMSAMTVFVWIFWKMVSWLMVLYKLQQKDGAKTNEKNIWQLFRLLRPTVKLLSTNLYRSQFQPLLSVIFGLPLFHSSSIGMRWWWARAVGAGKAQVLQLYNARL